MNTNPAALEVMAIPRANPFDRVGRKPSPCGPALEELVTRGGAIVEVEEDGRNEATLGVEFGEMQRADLEDAAHGRLCFRPGLAGPVTLTDTDYPSVSLILCTRLTSSGWSMSGVTRSMKRTVCGMPA